MPCVYMISTSGCVLQGDRLYVDIAMGPGSMAHVTTQSATKVHEMDANFASQVQTVTLAEHSYLELMPGMTIPLPVGTAPFRVRHVAVPAPEEAVRAGAARHHRRRGGGVRSKPSRGASTGIESTQWSRHRDGRSGGSDG